MSPFSENGWLSRQDMSVSDSTFCFPYMDILPDVFCYFYFFRKSWSMHFKSCHMCWLRRVSI